MKRAKYKLYFLNCSVIVASSLIKVANQKENGSNNMKNEIYLMRNEVINYAQSDLLSYKKQIKKTFSLL